MCGKDPIVFCVCVCLCIFFVFFRKKSRREKEMKKESEQHNHVIWFYVCAKTLPTFNVNEKRKKTNKIDARTNETVYRVRRIP